MKILIKVTKDILTRARMCGISSQNCAIALAANEFFPACSVSYNGDGVPVIHHYPTIGPLSIEMMLPNKAKAFMLLFDRSSPEERLLLPEISFEVNVPYSVINRIGISEAYRILSESKTLELIHP